MSCPDCRKGTILPGEPTGSIAPNGAYFAPGPSGTKSRAVILLTDIFGLPLVNSKLLADHFSKKLQCDVWVPDQFNGNPPFGVDSMKFPEKAGDKLEILPFLVGLIPALPALIRNRPSVVFARDKSFIEALQAEKKYEKLGTVGYCFGGSMALKLAGTDLVNSAVVCHPGPMSEQDVMDIKVPSSWVCAEEDMTFKPKLRQRAEEILASRKGKDEFTEYEFKDYKGTTHGFAARPNLGYPEVKVGYEGALEQVVQWFEKTLPV
ncbi:hypothetical protein D9757_003523 [Collybiopsis confluens]|uniref:Dienelactone hydrolase domain-containing protein n=1 Tax=Collybiopsis confluens TaxID=2823264 RepID=A0A8H5HTB8_9AGAR|nr:hypothetical protein D9757_003523 [Collybiopsis confluens]